MSGTKLNGAILTAVDLSGADLIGADLSSAVLHRVNLTGANLREAELRGTVFSATRLRDANVRQARLGETILANVDLRDTLGLSTCRHAGPSSVDHRTLMQSGELPRDFLRGCGLPETLISYLPALFETALQFHSCFISYSTIDEEFATCLHADLQRRGVRCWYAPHQMKAGRKLHEQIDEAIHLFDKLLVILSPSSIDSDWVRFEITKALRREREQQRRMLFPVRLVDFHTLETWHCFDENAPGKDVAAEIRQYHIPDFSNWKNAALYTEVFERLLSDLQSENTAT